MTIPTDTIAAVDDAIDAQADELVRFLSDLVAAETVTGNEKPGQDVVAAEFEAMGLEPDVWEPSADDLRDHEAFFETSTFADVGYEGRPNVVARLPGAGDGPELGLSGHIDVVSVTEDAWDSDPWTLRRDGDALYGRGSCDMKGGIAAYVTAVKALDAAGVELEGDLLLQSTIEEEDGGVGGVLSALERGYQPDAVVVPEPLNIPNVGLSSGGVMYFEVTVPGRTAHAATAFEGVDATAKAITVYETLMDLDRERKDRISYPRASRASPDLEGHVTNINVGVIRGGDWPSTVPGEVVLQGRVGWPPGETREEVRTQIRDAIEAAAATDDWLSEHPPTLEWFGWQAEPHEVDADAEIAQLAKRAAEAVTGEEGMFIGGSAGLDERFWKNYYDIDAVTVGPYGERLHGPNECTSLESLLETAKTHARIAMEFCGVAEAP
jgi:acetylornithine deacetylase